MRFINKKCTISASDEACIAKSLAFIDARLEEASVTPKLTFKARLLAEEMLLTLLAHADPGASVSIQVKKLLGDTEIHLRVRGQAFDLSETATNGYGDDLGDEETQAAIRTIILKSQGEKLKLSHRNGVNRVRILTGQTESSILRYTIIAMILGLVFGLFLSMTGSSTLRSVICDYLLNPFQTMFMNALKIVIAPVVFFSIVSCISQFQSMSELGRIGAKVLGMFLLTTIIAVFIAIGISLLLSPGEFGAALSGNLAMQSIAIIDTNVDTSLLTMLINIVPSNFLRPFLESDTLQLIFLAILCGMAVGMIGEYATLVKDFFEALHSLFLTITALITRLIPAVVFCSTALMLANLGGSSFVAILGMVGTVLVALAVMMFVYGVLVLVMGKLNPIVFYRKIREGMLTSFTLSSSSAAMPTNLRMCTDKLGISPKICNFSIPLGATINMDGLCITLVIIGCFLAKMYGVRMNGSAMLSLALTSILLSIGCPGVSGAGIICVGLILVKLGVPVEGIGFIISIFPVLDMFICMCNITGHICASAITANKEGLLNKELFYNGKY